MKSCLSSCANVSRPHKDALNFVNEWQLSIPLPMLAGGKDGRRAIEDSAKTSLICAGAPSSTICMFWLVPSRFKLSFRTRPDYLTGALADLFFRARPQRG